MTDHGTMRLSPLLARRLGLAILALLVAAYFAAFSRFAVNIPFLDDHGRIYGFLEQLTTLESFSDQVDHVLRFQTNEHRMVTMHLLVVALERLFGHVDLRLVMLVGSLAVPLLFLVFYVSLPRSEVRAPIYLAPLAMLLFVPLHQVTNWALVAVTYVCYLCGFASLLALERSKERISYLPVALALAVVATYTFGSGMFVFFAGTLLLLLPRVCWSRLVTWFLVGGLALFFYYHELRLPDHRRPMFELLIENPIQIANFFFLFLAAPFKVLFHLLQPQLLLGVLIAALIALMLIRQREAVRRSPLLLSYLAFVLLVALASAIGRGYALPRTANADRYQFTAALIVAVLYLLMLSRFGHLVRRHLGAILACSVLLYASRMSYNWLEMGKHHDMQRHELLRYHAGYEPAQAADIGASVKNGRALNEAIAAGHYRSPVSHLWPTPPAVDRGAPEPAVPIVWRLKQLRESDGWIYVSGIGAIKGERKRRSPRKYLALISARGGARFLYEATVLPSYDFLQLFPGLKDWKLYDIPTAGFEIGLEKTRLKIPDGDYDVGLLVLGEDGAGAFVETDATVGVGSQPAQS